MTTFLPYDVLPPAGLDPLRPAAAAYLARYKKTSPASTPNATCAPTCAGAPTEAWTRCTPRAPASSYGARTNLDRHPNYIVAIYMSSTT
jgi:hypothetical protein